MSSNTHIKKISLYKAIEADEILIKKFSTAKIYDVHGNKIETKE